MSNKVDFIIDIIGNADSKLSEIAKNTNITNSVFSKLGDTMVKLNAVIGVAQTAYNAVSASLSKIVSVGVFNMRKFIGLKNTTTYLMTTKLLHFFVPKAFLKRMKEALR